MKYKVILWGLGEQYNHLLNSIRYYELYGAMDIIGATDRRLQAYSEFDGYRIVDTSDIAWMDFDFIIVFSSKYYMEIREEITAIGIAGEKIISYKFLFLPGVDFQKYIELKNSRVSIVSNNCWGGIVYNTLGFECISPFKNLFLEDKDYLKMLKNMKYYLSCEPVFSKYIYDEKRDLEYPLIALDDVYIHCNHDTDAEEAVQKWVRRLKKFNFENVFIEMYTEDPDAAEEFSTLYQFPKKICFVPFDTDKEVLMKLDMYDNQTEFWETVNSNAGNSKNCMQYRLVDLLYMDNCSRFCERRLHE